MAEQTHGGRSSATPRERVQLRPRNSAGSRTSPLQLLPRKTPAHPLPVEAGFQSVSILLTVCTHRRQRILATKESTRLIAKAWQAATFWLVGRYVVLPDHLHLFCAPNRFPAEPLRNWIGCWRNHVTRAWSNRSELPLW